MPFVEVDDILSLGIDGRLDGQQILLTTHWRVRTITGAVNADMVALWDAWATELDAAGELGNVYPDVLSEDVTNLTYIMQDIYPTRYVRSARTPAFTDGQVVEPSLPPNVAHVITVRGDVANRANRGNKHIGGVPPSFTEGGMMTVAAAIVYDILGAALVDTMSVVAGAATCELEPIIYHRAIPVDSAPITSYILGTTTRVERRRTVGLGS